MEKAQFGNKPDYFSTIHFNELMIPNDKEEAIVNISSHAILVSAFTCTLYKLCVSLVDQIQVSLAAPAVKRTHLANDQQLLCL
ncbi:hypothetical protein [Flavobacterium psychrotrophum]|uniref:hypothetical protein n=1 Tax=Flavobacterium psychrotrophum TaxID=2294119 RepID=UPI000E31B1AC|nr:hypothetical protein [Flavobacterium psychrotrophum]